MWGSGSGAGLPNSIEWGDRGTSPVKDMKHLMQGLEAERAGVFQPGEVSAQECLNPVLQINRARIFLVVLS